MKKKSYSKLFNILGTLLCFLYFIVVAIEILNFTPYNKRLPFFADRMLEFLLPSILCFIIAHYYKKKS